MSDGWIYTKDELPPGYVSVQVYVPSQEPHPVVMEGYLFETAPGSPTHWIIPRLNKNEAITEIKAWRPFSEPPKEE